MRLQNEVKEKAGFCARTESQRQQRKGLGNAGRELTRAKVTVAGEQGPLGRQGGSCRRRWHPEPWPLRRRMKTHRDEFPQEAEREKVVSHHSQSLQEPICPKRVFIHFRGEKAKLCEGRRERREQQTD